MNSKESVLKFLKNNIRYSYNAPTIYRHLRGVVPVNTIRSDLKRLYEEKMIHKPSRGFYQAKVDNDTIDLLENPPTLVHAITINVESPKLQKLGQGAVLPNCKFSCWMDFLEWLEREGFKTSFYNGSSSKKMYSKRIWMDDRDVLITIHSNSGISLYFGCSNHPLGYLEFRDFYNYVCGYLSEVSPFCNEMVSQIGINKDFSEWDVHDFRSLRLKHFVNAWFQIYRKESIQRVRFECHVNPKPVLSVRDAFMMIESVSMPFRSVGVSRVDTREDVV